MNAVESLLTGAAEKLRADVVEDEESQAPRWYVDVRFGDGRKQRVFLYVGEGSPHYRHLDGENKLVYATSHVGALEPGLDLGLLLRKNSESSLAYVSVFFSDQAGDDELSEMIYTSAGLPLAIATPGALASLIDEVAGMADAMEEQLFGVDVH